jgi:hypothetical protein
LRQVDERAEPISSDDQLVIEQLAPVPRWYRYRFVLLGLLVLTLVGAFVSERVVGATRPQLAAASGGYFSGSGPPARTAEMGFVVINEGRFDAVLESVDLGPGMRSTVLAGQRNDAGMMTDQTDLPVRIEPGDGVSLVITAELRDCELLDPELTSIGMTASTPFGPTRHERVALDFFTGKREGAPSSYTYSGEDPWALGWQALLFAKQCPELTR